MMKTHTTIGQQILGGSRNRILEVASSIAVAHHERWDGNGYPHGLRGDDIPLEARIVAVADVFDSLTHTRPYKRAFPLQEALAEIDLNDGTQFDPNVVRAFMTIRERVGLENILELADPLDPLRDTRELSLT
jgi:putative two-component system response regulator